jgi:hypothetical protein
MCAEWGIAALQRAIWSRKLPPPTGSIIIAAPAMKGKTGHEAADAGLKAPGGLSTIIEAPAGIVAARRQNA